MKPRLRQWLAVGIALAFGLALMIGWSGYMNARNSPRLVQTPPGGMARPYPEGSLQMTLRSLTATPQLITDREVQPAPAGAVWVLALIDYVPEEGQVGCSLDLLASDGRRWSTADLLAIRGSRAIPTYCPATPDPGKPPQAQLVYLVPETALPHLVGVVSERRGHRGTEPYWVLTPPR